MAQCEYQGDPGLPGMEPARCPRPPEAEDARCALHSHAAWKDKPPQLYTEPDKQQHAAFTEQIEAALDSPARVVDSHGDERHVVDFGGVAFPHNFSLLEKRRVDAEITFAGARFLYNAGFHNTTFARRAVFAGAVFAGLSDFRGARFRAAADFGAASFTIANFDNTRFEAATFDKARFSRNTTFARARFQGAASFPQAVFAGPAVFDGSQFEAGADFLDATFVGQASFQFCRFRGPVGFPERRAMGWGTGVADFKARGLSPLSNEAKAETREPDLPPGFGNLFHLFGALFHDAAGGEDAFRKSKLIYRTQGDYFRAGYCYRMERHYTNVAMPWISRRFPWLGIGKGFDRAIGGWLCGWGEQPWRVIAAAILVITAFGLVFSAEGALGQDASIQNPSDSLVGQQYWWPNRLRIAIYFSGVTFTTLGYGDYHPVGAYGILATGEALIGAALLSLFVVCLARKLMH